MKLEHNSHNKDEFSNDYATPEYIFQALNIKPLEFSLDACAPEKSIWVNLPAAKYCKDSYALEEGKDARLDPFYGHVFMNPPYARDADKDKLMLRMREHGDGIALIPVDTTEWFYLGQYEAIFIPKKRTGFINFKNEDCKTANGGSISYCTALVAWGEWAVNKIMGIDQRILEGQSFMTQSKFYASQGKLELTPA